MRGKPEIWACGIAYALGTVNFLFDKTQTPHMRADELCAAFGVKQRSGSNKAKLIRDMFGMYQFDPNWCLPSLIDDNPIAWMLQINGLVVDARHMPREIQEIAYQKGLIPYIPADQPKKWRFVSGSASRPMTETHIVTPGNDPSLRESVLAFARRYEFEEGHSLQDERLALRLFDETAALGLHDMNEPALFDLDIAPRDILSYAAILHDIGYWYGYDKHHKHAFKMIMAGEIPGLSDRERTLVAHVARYHRAALPDPNKHKAFASLGEADQELVIQLAAILRFADGLDRTHTDAVEDLRCDLDRDRLIVTLLPGHGDETERWAGQKKARFFEQVFGVEVALR